MALESVACFDLLSHVVEGGGVLCRARLFLFWGVLCGGVYFSLLCIIAFFLYDIAVLLLLF
jgi:hypothetical protein